MVMVNEDDCNIDDILSAADRLHHDEKYNTKEEWKAALADLIEEIQHDQFEYFHHHIEHMKLLYRDACIELDLFELRDTHYHFKQQSTHLKRRITATQNQIRCMQRKISRKLSNDSKFILK